MNTPAKAKTPLRIEASHIGPIMGLQQDLSSEPQNLIFARNGTGKSFIARALRFLDHTVYSNYDASKISDLLVSEESANGKGSFHLYEGTTCVGGLELDTRSKNASRAELSYIFHVFTEDYIDEEVRNRLEELDGEIQHEIIIGRENVELDKKESALSSKMESIASRRGILDILHKERQTKHKADFEIIASLGAFKKLSSDTYFYPESYSSDSTGHSVEELQSQYNTLKALPTDPVLPARLNFGLLDLDVQSVHDALSKITSPSTVMDEFKSKIETDPTFFEAGLALYEKQPSECPFCTQPMQEMALAAVNKYIEYFKDEEAQEKEQLNKLTRRLETELSKVKQWSGEYLRQAAIYEELRGYFPSFSAKKLAAPDELIENIERYLNNVKDCVGTKRKDLTKGVDGPTEDISSTLNELISVVKSINIHFAELGTLANNTSAERRKIQNLSCERFENRFFKENSEEIKQIRELTSDSQLLSEQISKLKLTHGKSASARERVVHTFSALLKRFFGNNYTFDGETFKVRRNNVVMRRGSDRTLSDGEKAVLAFCYFLAQTHLKVNEIDDYSRLFFVFDDPVTSMSFDYIYTIIQTLKSLRIGADGDILFSPGSDQYRPKMLILTHNNYFFNVASANRVVRANGLFQLVPGESEHELASQTGFATPHMFHLIDVHDVATGARKADHTTPNSIRSVIEGIWKFCKPDISNFEEFLGYLIREHEIEIKSVMINDLSHGGKVADFPHDEMDIRQAATETIAVVEKFAEGQITKL